MKNTSTKDRKEHLKRYREKNKEKIAERNRNYYQKNKEKLKNKHNNKCNMDCLNCIYDDCIM